MARKKKSESLGSKLNNASFELQLVIIAILIPVFLNSFPSLVRSLLDLIPIFTFGIVKIMSISLGLLWFLVLMIGLIEFYNKERKIFDNSFKLIALSTPILMFAIIGSYVLYIINLWIGHEKIIYSITLIFIVILTIISVRLIKNK